MKEFNTSIKFAPVMEDVLLALLVLFVLNGNSKMTEIVNELCRLSDRSPNAVGSALKDLSQLKLIDYYRKGQFPVCKKD